MQVRNIFKFMKSLPYMQEKSWSQALAQIQKEIKSVTGTSTQAKMDDIYETYKKRVLRDWSLLDWHSLPNFRADMSNNTNERYNKSHKNYILDCNAIRSIDMILATREWLQCRAVDYKKIKADTRIRHESHVNKKNAFFKYASEVTNVKKLFEKIIE